MAAITAKALVLGGKNGLLGQALVRVLEEKGWSVDTLSRTDVDYFSNNVYDSLSDELDRLEPTHVFNAVAYTNVEKAEEEPEQAIALNRRLPSTLGRLAASRSFSLVHFSTDFVFDGRKKTPYTTDDTPAPLSSYGRSKYEGEQALQDLSLNNCCIIRTAWLFGPGRDNFVRKIIGICQEKHKASVVFDQIGSPTYSMDLARHTLELVDIGAEGLFHIANSGQANWSELASEAVSCLQLECLINPILAQDFPSKAVRPAYSVLDCTSFTQITSTKPRAWPQALREYLMLEYPAGI
ncbi:MAG: dTDP-4-dehydrorhamnose reductase [Deltaproteobacteria bacterium]|jgi:dTDP-4-dehydrorhamnose reductase|nr:dTDP-4-dehydrorhamnose reductase [Deltaproteobacteria bacterium]